MVNLNEVQNVKFRGDGIQNLANSEDDKLSWSKKRLQFSEINGVFKPFYTNGEVKDEYFIAHQQYLEDWIVDNLNTMSNEIYQLDCASRKNTANLIGLVAPLSGIEAAKLIGFDKCERLSAFGGTVKMHQCQKMKAVPGWRNTPCGYEPAVNNLSLSLDGYTVVSPTSACLHDRNFANIGGEAMFFNNTHWEPAVQSVAISHIHLGGKLDYKVDSAASSMFAETKSDRTSFGDLLGELSALTENMGGGSVSNLFPQTKTDQVSKVPDVSGVISTYFTGWRDFFYTAIAVLMTLALMYILCVCIGPAKLLGPCCAKQTTQSPVVQYAPVNPDTVRIIPPLPALQPHSNIAERIKTRLSRN